MGERTERGANFSGERNNAKMPDVGLEPTGLERTGPLVVIGRNMHD